MFRKPLFVNSGPLDCKSRICSVLYLVDQSVIEWISIILVPYGNNDDDYE